MAEKWEPLPYQLRAAEHLVENSYAGIFLTPGLRKTSITLAAFKVLKKVGLVKAMLVLAPLRVCYTSWPNEVRKWKDFERLSVGILHGAKKARVLQEKHDLYVCNYDGLQWLCDELRNIPTKDWPFDMLVADESTKLKRTETLRFKALKPLLKYFKRRVILTGSPTANGRMNLFGQCYVMDQGRTLSPYITYFRKEYFYQVNDYDWVLKPGADVKMDACLAPLVFYAHAEDHLQLPPLIEKVIEIELPPKVRRMYDQMEAILRLQFKEGKVTAANTATALMKCRQIANGGVYLDDDGSERRWQQLHDEKTEAVLDLVEELSGQPALITYDFLHDLERLKKALGKDTPHIGRGGVKPKDLPALIQRWNRGDVPYVIVNPQSMAHGVDGFQEAGRAVIWHSLTYNGEDYEQLIRRLRRSGQTERVLVAHIIAKNTVDEAMYATVTSKLGGQNAFFSALKAYWA